LEFFSKFAIPYLEKSRVDDLDVHKRSVDTFIKGIKEPDTLERFKPAKNSV